MSTTNTSRGHNSGTGKLSDGFDAIEVHHFRIVQKKTTARRCERRRAPKEEGCKARGESSETVGTGRVGTLILTLSRRTDLLEEFLDEYSLLMTLRPFHTEALDSARFWNQRLQPRQFRGDWMNFRFFLGIERESLEYRKRGSRDGGANANFYANAVSDKKIVRTISEISKEFENLFSARLFFGRVFSFFFFLP